MKYSFTPSHLHITESSDSTERLASRKDFDFNKAFEQSFPGLFEQSEIQVPDAVMRRLFLKIRLLSKKNKN